MMLEKVSALQLISNDESTVSVKSLDDMVSENSESEQTTTAVQYLMQQFMNDMYSSVDECPFSVTNNQEW